MMKYILYLFVLAALSFAPSMKTMASNMMMVEFVDNEFAKVGITANGSTLRVTGAEGLVLRIFNIAGGQPVMQTKIDSDDKTFDLNLPKGVYIVQVVNKATRKIVIK